MHPVNILLIEDNADHALIIRKGLQAYNVINEVKWVEDGEEALDYLFARGPYAGPEAPARPGLILLDIKLPKVDGFGVLEEIKRHPELKAIPVIMLTSSEQEVDIVKSYRNGANSYVTKPIEFDQFLKVVRELEFYWVLVSRLPLASR